MLFVVIGDWGSTLTKYDHVHLMTQVPDHADTDTSVTRIVFIPP